VPPSVPLVAPPVPGAPPVPVTPPVAPPELLASRGGPASRFPPGALVPPVGDASRSGPASLLPPDPLVVPPVARLPPVPGDPPVPEVPPVAGVPPVSTGLPPAPPGLVPPLLFLAQPAATRQAESNNVAKRPVRRDLVERIDHPMSLQGRNLLSNQCRHPSKGGHHGMGKTLPQSGRLTSSPASQSCLSCRPSAHGYGPGATPCPQSSDPDP